MPSKKHVGSVLEPITWKLAAVVGIPLFVLSTPARGESIAWSNSAGGVFQEGNNWFGGSPPGPADTAAFGGLNAMYTVSFSAGATSESLEVTGDTVTLDLNGFTYDGLLVAYVGQNSTAALTLSNGSLVSTGLIVDVGFVTVGSSATMQIGGIVNRGLFVGNAGSGVLRIEGGGTVTSTWWVETALASGSSGDIVVTGAGSTLQTTSGMLVGQSGPGTLRIEDGAFASCELVAVVGFGPGVAGDVTVADPGSLWQVLALTVGHQGDGSVTIDGGAQLQCTQSTIIAGTTGSSGDMRVSGSGSEFNAGGNLQVGAGGPALLTVSEGGLVQRPTGIQIGPFGTVVVSSGGMISAEGPVDVGIFGPGGTATLSVSGAGSRVEVADLGFALGVGAAGPGVVVVESGGSIITEGLVRVQNESGAGVASIALTGSGSSWTATGDFEFGLLGPAVMTVSDGALMAKSPDPFIVGPDGEVSGDGLIRAHLVNQGTVWAGTKNPSPLFDALTIDGDYTQEGLGTLVVEIASGSSDMLAITGHAVLGGTLLVTAVGGFTPAPGQSFEILTFGSREGSFATIDGGGFLFEQQFDANSMRIVATGGADCNNNGIPDDEDISLGSSDDCNGNGVPDECEIAVGSPAPGGPFFCIVDCDPDCNANGVPDTCDIDGGDADCNENGVPDKCEIAEGTPGGPFFCAENCAADCKPNGIPDECDIDPGLGGSSGDCTNFGVPDECDIRDEPGIVDTDPEDGIPDNCVSCATGTASDCGLGSGSGDAAVVVGAEGGANVAGAGGVVLSIDVPVTIASLRVLGGSTVKVTGAADENLTVTSPDGVLLRGDLADPFAVSEMLVANDRVIDVTGAPVRVERGAAYRADPSAGESVSASLISESLTLVGNKRSLGGGTVELSDSMSVATGNLVMDGTGTASCGGTIAGGRTPPTLRFSDVSRMTVTGDFVMSESAELSVDVLDNANDPAISLGGDFVNESVDACAFDWVRGTLRLNGTQPQEFEVAGRDLGLSASGFDTGTDTNFSIRRLALAANSDVTFSNRFANTVGAASESVVAGVAPDACLEAMYANTLILGASATATLNNSTVYYAVLTDQGGNVSVIGCSSLLELPGCDVDADCDDGSFCNGESLCLALPNSGDGVCEPAVAPCGLGEVCEEETDECRPDCLSVDAAEPEAPAVVKNRYVSFAPGNPGETVAVRVSMDQVAGFDGFNGGVRWVGQPLERIDEGLGTITVAPLQCEPFFADWTDYDVVHAYGDAVVPDSKYTIQIVHDSCQAALDDDFSFSDPLVVGTAKWGDVVDPLFTEGGPAQPDFGDIAALVDKFTAIATAPIKARAQLQPNVPDPSQAVNFSDIAIVVDAFTGQPYPFTGPSACP